MEFSRKVKFTLDGEIYFKRINNKSLCSLLTERVTAVCEEQTKLGKVVFRTAIEAEILYQALYVHVQRLNTSLTKCQTRYCMEPRPSVDDCKVMRFLKRLSGKTPREQNSSGKKIGAESAVLHFVFFIVIVNKMQQSAKRIRINKNILFEVFPLTIGSGKTVPFEKRHAGCEERKKINRRRIYDTLRINFFEATKQTACIFSKGGDG